MLRKRLNNEMIEAYNKNRREKLGIRSKIEHYLIIKTHHKK